jgi:trk system potassium uptake protein TrkA
MDLKSIKFLSSLNKETRQFAVIGLGRFGRGVCSTLHNLGYEVIATDIDEKKVAQALADRIVFRAVQLDSTEPLALREGGITELDTVIIAIGNYIQESIVTTLNVKEAGVKYVVAKASSDIHGKLLQKVGADHVVFPEHDAGCALAYTLTKPSILHRLELDPNNSIVEVLVPDSFNGKTLAELQLRNRYGVNVLAICNGDKFDVNPLPELRLNKGSAMIVIGSNKDIKRLPL